MQGYLHIVSGRFVLKMENLFSRHQIGCGLLLIMLAITCTSFVLQPLRNGRVGGQLHIKSRSCYLSRRMVSHAVGNSFILDPTADDPLENFESSSGNNDGKTNLVLPSSPPACGSEDTFSMTEEHNGISKVDEKQQSPSKRRSILRALRFFGKNNSGGRDSAPNASSTIVVNRSPSTPSMVTRLMASANNDNETTGHNNDHYQGKHFRTLEGENAIQVLANLLASDQAKKLVVWLSFFGLGWKLRSFYGIILGTFVLSYIGSSAVRWSHINGNRLLQRLKLPQLPRRIWAFLYVSLVLNAIMTLTVISVPRVVGETNYISLLIESENPYVFVADGIRNYLGPDVTTKLETFLLTVTGEEGRSFASGVLTARAADSLPSGGVGAAVKVGRGGLNAAMNDIASSGGVWNTARSSRFAKLIEFSLKGYIKQGYYVLTKLLTSSTKMVYKGLLSLLFSFMIIWDLPRLGKGIQKLGESRLGFAYKVLKPQVTAFAKLVGQSFEVQSIIAVVNTILTTLGLVLLKIPGYGFMSLLVLISSFIPVFGVFLSTFPMALIALSEYGVRKMIDVILMVIGIHVVEAYCLSPLIYSATVKLHPVLIVAALYMMEHLAGLQGVFLAVPVTMFLIKQVVFGNVNNMDTHIDENPQPAIEA